jgi:hypothetical protein
MIGESGQMPTQSGKQISMRLARELARWARFDKRILDAFADSSLTNSLLTHNQIEVVQEHF